MSSSDSFLRERVSLLGLGAVIALGLLFLAGKLWGIQVRRGSEFQSSMERQSIRRVRLPAQRGLIFDRNGICLADNEPNYCVAIYIEELRQAGKWSHTVDEVERVIALLSEVMGVPAQVDRAAITRHIRRRLPLPFLAWRGISEASLARWAESSRSFPGVDVYVEPVRLYPLGSVASHVLGYVGRAEPPVDEPEPYHYYLPEVEGKYGIERTFNATLSGAAGGRLIRVDASGFKHTDVAERHSLPGRDVVLTLDSRIQSYAERMLLGERGAVVVMDPRGGDILAIASAPTFDPNVFSPRIPEKAWARMLQDPGKPLFNRAISGTYPPGSTFKPIVALAALENGGITAEQAFDCPGVFKLGGQEFRCWTRRGHGMVAMRRSLEQSCNCYYCQVGIKIGYDRIYHMADAVGFGKRTGVELSYEAAGLLPDDAWKRRVMKDGWRGGDTCNASIGQGALTVTPLQMAMVTSALANGGLLYRPRIALDADRGPELIQKMAWSPGSLEVVRGGMRDVVEVARGTGWRARISGVTMAGKTGTAEYGPRDKRRKYGWMILFAPYEAPRYVVVMVVEDTISGGINVAPRLRELMERIFSIEQSTVTGDLI